MNNEQINQTAIRTEVAKSKITVEDVFKSDFQKEGTLSAQLRQIVTTKSFYPSKRIDNNMQDNVFNLDEFGFGEQKFESVENRVAWLDIPVGTTVEQVVGRIQTHVDACLYKVLSNTPILTDSQEYAIGQGLRTIDDFANTQVVRYPDGTMKEGVDVSGQIVLDKNNNVQYRRVFFSSKPKADIDKRSTTANVYMSPEIQMELRGASVIAEQTI